VRLDSPIALHVWSVEILLISREAQMIIYRSDQAITDEEDRQLRNLLCSCFPTNPVFLARRFFLRRPGHRWLVKTPAGEIIGHAALHEKSIGTESGDLLVGGVAEVCVATNHRGSGISKKLLQSIDSWLMDRGISFALLFGQPRVYRSSGYVPIRNELKADNLLIGHWNPFCGTPMVKALSQIPWPPGVIDLRGPTF
jgi:GNAT superfamily N-acetyltransferase